MTEFSRWFGETTTERMAMGWSVGIVLGVVVLAVMWIVEWIRG